MSRNLVLKELYQQSKLARSDSGMNSETYEEYLERKIGDLQDDVMHTQDLAVCLIDVTENGDKFLTDEQAELLYIETTQKIIRFMRQRGWDIKYDSLRYLRISHMSGRFVDHGRIRRL